MALAGHASHVQKGVTHPAEGCVDADSGDLGNFFEAHVAIEAHVEHFTLSVRKFAYQSFDVGQCLITDESRFDASLGKACVVEKVCGDFVV